MRDPAGLGACRHRRDGRATRAPDDDERRLLARLRRRDEEAFRDLVVHHAPVVRAYASGLLGDPAEAEDAAQETFLRAHRRLAAFRGDASLQTWLLRICRNHCIDRLRARGGVSLVELTDETAAGAADATTDALAAAVDRERLVAAIAALPEPLQQALVLRELRGLSYDEVAQSLGVPVGTVRSRLSTGRDLLRRSLERP